MSASDRFAYWPAWRRVPPFLPVPLRARADGWTPQRQADFIGWLAETGSVSAAARRVGMSRIAAYGLRRCREAGSFIHAWDTVAARWRGQELPNRKFTAAELRELAIEGPFVILMRRRRFVRARRKPDASALLRFIARMDRFVPDEAELWA